MLLCKFKQIIKMKYLLSIIIFFVICICNSYSQIINNKSIELEVNIGSAIIDYEALKIRDSKFIIDNYEIPFKLVNDYKPRVSYGFSLGIISFPSDSNYVSIGLSYFHYSNASRISYADFSGDIHIDNLFILNQLCFSVSPRIYIFNKNVFIKPQLQAGIVNFNINSIYNQKILDSDTTSNSYLSKTSICSEISLRICYEIKNYYFGISSAYFYEYGELKINSHYLNSSSIKFGIFAGMIL